MEAFNRPAFTPGQVGEMLRAAIKDAGTQKEFAEMAGVSTSFLNDVVHGKRSFGVNILDELNLRRSNVTYQPVDGFKPTLIQAPPPPCWCGCECIDDVAPAICGNCEHDYHLVDGERVRTLLTER